jgi:Flp pilus assembly protein TadG
MTLECRLRRGRRLPAAASPRARNMRDECGGSLVEFAIALPILLTLLTGAASFSLAFYTEQQMGVAAAYAVQTVATEQGDVQNGDPCNLAMTSVQGAAPSLTSASISYSLTVSNASGTGTTFSSSSGSNGGNTSFSCGTSSSNPVTTSEFVAGEPVILTIKYSYKWLPILSFSPSAPLTVTTAAMAD